MSDLLHPAQSHVVGGAFECHLTEHAYSAGLRPKCVDSEEAAGAIPTWGWRGWPATGRSTPELAWTAGRLRSLHRNSGVGGKSGCGMGNHWDERRVGCGRRTSWGVGRAVGRCSQSNRVHITEIYGLHLSCMHKYVCVCTVRVCACVHAHVYVCETQHSEKKRID